MEGNYDKHNNILDKEILQVAHTKLIHRLKMEGNYDKHNNILDKEILNYYNLQTRKTLQMWGSSCKKYREF